MRNMKVMEKTALNRRWGQRYEYSRMDRRGRRKGKEGLLGPSGFSHNASGGSIDKQRVKHVRKMLFDIILKHG
jgi:hypothetical protein